VIALLLSHKYFKLPKAHPFLASAPKHDPTLLGKLPSEIVKDRHFLDEVVEADGRLFENCHFTNVTLKYDGHASSGFMEPHFFGPHRFEYTG
jgi:hypothetical protein